MLKLVIGAAVLAMEADPADKRGGSALSPSA